jgi:hypothetical protein
LEVSNVTQKQPKPPNTQRSFVNSWGELDYLCQKMRYWLYTRKQKAKAGRYLERLARVLRELPENDGAIIREEGLALLHELKGELDPAIAHREREIRLTELLHREAQFPRYAAATRSYMLRSRDLVDLQERRAILETLKMEQTRRQPGCEANVLISM